MTSLNSSELSKQLKSVEAQLKRVETTSKRTDAHYQAVSKQLTALAQRLENDPKTVIQADPQAVAQVVASTLTETVKNQINNNLSDQLGDVNTKLTDLRRQVDREAEQYEQNNVKFKRFTAIILVLTLFLALIAVGVNVVLGIVHGIFGLFGLNNVLPELTKAMMTAPSLGGHLGYGFLLLLILAVLFVALGGAIYLAGKFVKDILNEY